MKQNNSKQLLVIMVTVLVTFHASAGMWEELSGRAAKDRVREARRQVRVIQNHLNNESQKISRVKKNITQAQERNNKLNANIISYKVGLKNEAITNISKIDQSIASQNTLVQKIENLHNAVKAMRLSFNIFHQSADRAVEGIRLSQDLGQYLVDNETTIMTFTRAYFDLKGKLPPNELDILQEAVKDMSLKFTHPSAYLYGAFIGESSAFLEMVNQDKMKDISQSLLTIESYANAQLQQVKAVLLHYGKAKVAYQQVVSSL